MVEVKRGDQKSLPRALAAAVFISGSAGLIYQSVWMRYFALIFGSTTQAASMVVAVFMGGLALGAAAGGRWRLRQPLKYYTWVEWGMGISALAVLPMLRGFPPVFGGFVAGHAFSAPQVWAIKAGLAAVLVLPTTLFCGATLPLLAGSLGPSGMEKSSSFSALYGWNTLGAAFGVLAATYVLVPWLGLSGTVMLAAAANLGVGEMIRRKRPSLESPAVQPALETADPDAPSVVPWLALAGGISALALEIVWMRTFSLVIGSSIYAFNLVLAVLLAGMALGTWTYGKARLRFKDTRAWLGGLLLAQGVLILGQGLFMGSVPGIFLGLRRSLSSGFAASQLSIVLICLLCLGPVTFLQGLTFPLLVRLPGGGDGRRSSGRLLAWNTAGAVAGALAAGFLLGRWVSLQSAYGWAALFTAGGGLFVLARRQAWPGWARLAVPAVLVSGLAFLPPWFRTWDPLVMSSGVFLYGNEGPQTYGGAEYLTWLKKNCRMLFYAEGREAVVSAHEVGGTVRSLQVNGKTDAGNQPDKVTQKLVAHIPLFLHPSQRVLVIGWGSGGTAGSASLHAPRQLTCVEIEPATLGAAPWFEELNFGLKPGPGFDLLFGDGRNYLSATAERFDSIISEPSNPWLQGPCNLFTREFFQLARSRLAPGGVFSSWFHFYNMSESDLRKELRTFCRVFPYASLWIPNVTVYPPVVDGDLILIGSESPHRLDLAAGAAVYANPKVSQDLRSVGRPDALSLACDYLAGRDEILAYAGEGPDNSDDRPGLEYSAPRNLSLSPEQASALHQQVYAALENSATALHPPVQNLDGLAQGAPAKVKAAAYLNMGDWLAAKSMPTRAEKLVKAAEELGAVDDWRIWLIRGKKAAREHRPREAAAAFEKVLSLKPTHREVHLLLGMAYFELRDAAKALDLYRHLSFLDPRMAQPYYLQATVLVNTGRFAEGRTLLDKALSISPDLREAQQLDQWMKERKL